MISVRGGLVGMTVLILVESMAGYGAAQPGPLGAQRRLVFRDNGTCNDAPQDGTWSAAEALLTSEEVVQVARCVSQWSASGASEEAADWFVQALRAELHEEHPSLLSLAMANPESMGELENRAELRMPTPLEALCGVGDSPDLVRSDEARFQLASDGALSLGDGEGFSFCLPAHEGELLVRLRQGERVLACQAVRADEARCWRTSDPPNERPVSVELFTQGMPTDRERIATLVDAYLFSEPDSPASTQDLLRAALDAADEAGVREIVRPIWERAEQILPSNDPDTRRFLQAAVQQRRRLLDQIEQTLSRSPWAARRLADRLPASREIKNVKRILDWYSLSSPNTRPRLMQRHILPGRAMVPQSSLAPRALRPSNGEANLRLARYGSHASTPSDDFAGEQVALVLTHVPTSVRPRFRENQTLIPREDVAATIVGTFARWIGVFSPPALHESQVRLADVAVDAGVVPSATYGTYTHITRTIERGTELSVWACSADCPDEANATVQNQLTLRSERLFGLVALASLSVGTYVFPSTRLELEEAGSSGPDQLYRVQVNDERIPLTASFGLGVRMGDFLLSANLATLSRNAPAFRTWLFGFGFRVPAISRAMYFQVFAGFARVETLRDVARDDVLAVPAGQMLSLPMERRRTPLLGLGLSFDIGALGSSVAGFIKKIGG